MAELQFTPAQLAAMTDRDGALLVSAAAGSGKTRVLVERLMRRVLDPTAPSNIDDFLVITFTKKAAAELRARIAKALTEALAAQPANRHLSRQLSRLGLAQITTIDGFCSDLVRSHAFALNISPDFRQIEADEAEQLRTQVADAVLEEGYRRMNEDPEFRHLIDTLGAGRGDGEIERAMQQVYNSAQCHIDPEAWIEQCIQTLDMTQYDDAGQTPWGSLLIAEFARFCEGKITILQAAVRCSAAEPTVQMRYGPVLEREIAQLKALSELDSWDALHGAAASFDKLPSFKHEEKTDLQEQVKKMRDDCKAALKQRLAEFSASSETVMGELGQTGRALTALFRLVRRFSEAYAREKRRLRVQDFSDLEHGAVALLLYPDGTPRPLAKELSTRYEQIMLDEYQDTNEVQDRIFRALSRDGKNRFMVGDVKQAIYRFRLADPEIFLKKYRSYSPAASAKVGEPRKILLSENFRSDIGILEAANAVFSACMSEQVGGLHYGEEEKLRQGMPRPELPGRAVELHCINTKPLGSKEAAPDKDAVEADFVARRIRRLLDEQTLIADGDGLRPVRAEDIVILLRSVASTAPLYAAALQAQGLVCMSDQQSSLLDTPEIETLLNLLRVIDNPRQDIPLASVLLSPLVGMSADTLATIRAEQKQGELYEALKASSAPQAAAFLQMLCRLRDAAERLELSALLTEISAVTQLEEIYGLFPDGAQRLARIERLFELAAGFAEGGRKSLSQFLSRIETMQLEQTDGLAARAGAVRLMSIHKSKGLEFPVVVLAGLSRRFNDQDYRQQVLLHPQLGAGCNVYDADGRYRYHSIAKRAIIARSKGEDRDEELRVLYVAMTRAQSRLIMTYCGGALDGKLRVLSQRLTLPPEPLLAAEATCLGDWVLEAALLRTEAGELFAAGQKPLETQVSDLPWEIRYHEIKAMPEVAQTAPEPVQTDTQAPDIPSLETALGFTYPAQAATAIPSKITATQLKGRGLDEEVSDGRPSKTLHAQRRPLFDEERPLTAAERGTATHLAMQYLDFSKTDSEASIAAELRRLMAEEYLTAQQAEAVSAERLYRIFAGPVGQRIAQADKVVREFKFSVLVDADLYAPEGKGEKMLLQGVTDCCLIKDGALTVIDFKTDRVRSGEEQAAAERYRGQLEAYSLALGRIFGLPVAEKLLYFFATDTPVRVD